MKISSAACAHLPAAIAIAILAPAMSAQDLPAGKGRETFKAICTSCHDAETTTNLRNTRGGWVEVITAMKNNGADGTEAQFTEVLDYLTVNFGRKDDGSAKKAGSSASAGVGSIERPAAAVALRPVPWEKNRLRMAGDLSRELRGVSRCRCREPEEAGAEFLSSVSAR